jgi:hypothetical protein
LEVQLIFLRIAEWGVGNEQVTAEVTAFERAMTEQKNGQGQV